MDFQVIPTSSPLSSDLSVSESSSSALCTPPHSSSSQLSAISSSSSQARNSEPSNRPSTSQILKTWPETFQVPWEKMPKEIRSAIADGKRPKPAERRQMVRVLADEMRRYEANPTRTQCLTVVRNIIGQYPKNFADMTPDGSLLGGGYTSLLIQVKNRIENVNRDGSFSHHRSSTHKRGPTHMDVQDFSQSSPLKKLMRLWSSTARDWRRFTDRRVQVEQKEPKLKI